MLATAPKALLRPFQSRARSSSSAAVRTLTAPHSAAISATRSAEAATPPAGPSTSTSSTAAASRG